MWLFNKMVIFHFLIYGMSTEDSVRSIHRTVLHKVSLVTWEAALLISQPAHGFVGF